MADTGSLTGETAVVTGASSGIGETTARALAAAGCEVVLAARRADRLEAIATEIRAQGGVAEPVPTDVTEEAAVDALVDATVSEFGGLDVVVANAGVGLGEDVVDMDTEDYRQMMAVNVDGVFYLTRAALPHVLDSAGTLIYVGSFAGEYPRAYNPVYAASKWWVRGFAKSVMAQVGDEGVGVSIVNPSEVRTEFGDADGTPFRERFDPGSVTEPGEIAEAVTFAASRAGSTAAEIDLFRRDKFTDFS